LYEALSLLVVGVADAVVDPRTVVVHLEHTSPAVLAVVRSVRLELAAFSGRRRQHTSAYVSAYVSIRQRIRQHTSAYVSTRQHTSAYVSKLLSALGTVSREVSALSEYCCLGISC
jgi:hypothetical protein